MGTKYIIVAMELIEVMELGPLWVFTHPSKLLSRERELALL